MSKTIQSIGEIVLGIGLEVAGALTANPALIMMGATTMLTGIGGLLTKPNKPAGSPGSLSLNQGAASRRTVYGVFQTAGALTYAHAPSNEEQDVNDQFLELVYTLTSHEIQAFLGVVIDGVMHNFGNDLTWDSSVGFWYCTNTGDLYYNHIGFEFDIGNPNNSLQPFPNLQEQDAQWTSSCLQQGRAKVHVQIRYDASHPNIYSNGRIPNFMFMVVGKPILDPRVSTAWPGAVVTIPQWTYLVDGNGYIWVATTGGATGSSMPAFTGSDTVGSTLTDGGVTWRCCGTYASAIANRNIQGAQTLSPFSNTSSPLNANAWLPVQSYAQYSVIEAPMGYLQILSSSAITSGTTQPASFGTILGVTTSDGGGTWTCLGRSMTAINPSNSALVVNDYLCDTDFGLAADPTTVDQTALAAAANICEEQVVIISPGGSNVYENLYSCDGMFDQTSTRGNVLQGLLSSMAGYAVPPGDAWRIYAGSYVTPTISLGDIDVRDTIKGSFAVSRREICNGVKGTFVPRFLPTNTSSLAVPPAWAGTDFPAYQGDGVNGRPDFLTPDGGHPTWKDIQLDFTTSIWTAQRIAKITLMRIRFGQVLTVPFKLSAYQLQAADTMAFTHSRWGLSAAVFQVQRCTLAQDASKEEGQTGLGVDVVLRQTDASIYEFNPTEYSAYNSTGAV